MTLYGCQQVEVGLRGPLINSFCFFTVVLWLSSFIGKEDLTVYPGPSVMSILETIQNLSSLHSQNDPQHHFQHRLRLTSSYGSLHTAGCLINGIVAGTLSVESLQGLMHGEEGRSGLLVSNLYR